MSKVKLRWISIAALVALLAVTLGLAFHVLPHVSKASAAPVSPTTVFQTVGNASIEPTADAEEKGDWTRFRFSSSDTDGGKVQFRRNLALKWFAAENEEFDYKKPEGDARINPGKAHYFSTSFAFPSIEFTAFTITMESSEENISKKGESSNALVFLYDSAANTLKLELHNSAFDAETNGGSAPAPSRLIAEADRTAVITISFAETLSGGEPCDAGDFAVYVSFGEGKGEYLGNFTNIGGNFIRSSGDTLVPLTFEAELRAKAAEEEKVTQIVEFHSLNEQTFDLNEEGKVVDNAPGVLAINEKIYPLRLGQKFSITYQAIDVLSSSTPSVTSQYYMLRRDADAAEDQPEEGDGPATYAETVDDHYVLPADSDYKTLRSSTYFFPPTDESEDDTSYVSIRYRVSDGTFTENYVYLTWYAAPGAVETLGDEAYETTASWVCPECKSLTDKEYHDALDANADAVCTGEKDDPADPEGETKIACGGRIDAYEIDKTAGNYFDYLIVNREIAGPSYIGITADESAKENGYAEGWDETSWNDAVADYQQSVEDAAKDVSAGDGAYFYLPSLRPLIQSNYVDYRNLRFSIYYYKHGTAEGSSASSATSLRYDGLRFEVDQRGYYRFRVVAQDAAGNTMKYFDEDNNLVTVSGSNVWDIDAIPEFRMYIGYTGPSIEDSDTQTEGHRDQNYSISNFSIIALDGYETDYNLYYFDPAALPADKTVTYADLVEALKKEGTGSEKTNLDDGTGWLWNCIKDNEIPVYSSEITEDDEEWADTNAYAWDPDSSLSFTPQAKGFYVVKVTVTDAEMRGGDGVATAYKAINVQNPIDTILGSSRWLESNTTAIVLFSISAALLIAIVLLLVIKPSNKNVEEVDLSKLKGRKKK